MAKQSAGHLWPIAPTYQTLPTAKPRAARGGPEKVELCVQLEVVTPIFGGSYQTRTIDDVDVIRVPSIRGHLRFWWRTLYAARYENTNALYQRESALWGRAATDDGGRSTVEIRVSVKHAGGEDKTDIQLVSNKQQQATPGAYALWPARAEKSTKTPLAPRRQPGTRFQLTLQVAGSATDEAEVRNAVRAWILFGGYGARTRRGLGSLKVIDNVNQWLPTAATREAFTRLFGADVFTALTQTPGDVPWLQGATIHVGRANPKAPPAWTTALDWLKEFRQGTTDHHPLGRAREPGTGKEQPHRPSISNWPEADKVRQLCRPQRRPRWAHMPRHNPTPAWPRAGFGLPIIGQFQTQDRNGKSGAYNEPDAFELRWRAGNVEHDRLASPLIVKALPLADGLFVPCALWLNRAYPANGEVVLRSVGNSNAPFDRLVATGDNPAFAALANKTSLRQAFLDWLHEVKQTTVVTL